MCRIGAHLHPEKESFGSSFKLQHIHSARCALIHPFELAVIGEDNQVLERVTGFDKKARFRSLNQTLTGLLTHVVHVPSRPILPTEVDERVIGLLDVDLSFPLVGSYRAALHRHLTCPKLHQVLAGGATRPGHHAGEQSSRCHDDVQRLGRRKCHGM